MTARVNIHSSHVRNAQPAPSQPSSSKKVGFLTALFYFFFGWLFAPKKTMDDLRPQVNQEPPASAHSTTDKTSQVATGRSANKVVAPRGSKKASQTESPKTQQAAVPSSAQKSPSTNPSPTGSPKTQQAAAPKTAQKSPSTNPSPTGSPKTQQAAAPKTAQKSPSTNPSPTGSPKTQQAAAPKTEVTTAQTELKRELEQLGFAAEALIENCKKNLNESELTNLHATISKMAAKNQLLNSSKWNHVIQVAWSAYKDLYEKLKQKNEQLAVLSGIVASFSTAESITPEKIVKGFELLAALNEFGDGSFTQVQREKINECENVLNVLKKELQKHFAQVKAIVDGIDDEGGTTPDKIARGLALTTQLKKFAKVLSKDEFRDVINFELLFNAKNSEALNDGSNLKGDYILALKAAQLYLNNNTVKDKIEEYAKVKPDYAKAVAQIRSAKENDPSSLFAGELNQKKMQLALHPDRNFNRQEEARDLFKVVNAAVQALSK